MSCETIEQILSAQANQEVRLTQADDIIYNDRDLNHTKQQIFHLHQRYLKLAKQRLYAESK